MSDGTPFLRVAADRIGAPGSPAKTAIPRHQRRQLVLNHPDRREDGRHSKANCTSSGFEPHSTGWEGSIWGIPVNIGCRYSTPVRKRPLHPTRGHFTPEPSQTQAPVTPATEPERRAGGSS